MKGSHYTVESPAVREILSGVYKNATRNYFRIAPDGRCEVFAVRTQLMSLGMGSTSASKILEAAKIPVANFVLNPVVKLEGVTVIRANVEVYGAGPLEEEPAERDDQGRWIGSPSATIVVVGQVSIEHDDDTPVCDTEETALECSVTEDLTPQFKPVKKNGPTVERDAKLASG